MITIRDGGARETTNVERRHGLFIAFILSCSTVAHNAREAAGRVLRDSRYSSMLEERLEDFGARTRKSQPRESLHTRARKDKHTGTHPGPESETLVSRY